MIVALSFLALTIGLALVAEALNRRAQTIAFLIVAAALLVMVFAWGEAHGVIAFAVWTLASYLLLNFPAAATLYLVSAFLYLVPGGGWYGAALQIASNATGLAGLWMIWNAKPKWEYVGGDRARTWGGVAVGYDTHRRNSQDEKGTTP